MRFLPPFFFEDQPAGSTVLPHPLKISMWLYNSLSAASLISTPICRFTYEYTFRAASYRSTVSIFRNGCTENFHFALRRCDWLEQLSEYAANDEIFCLFYYHRSTPSSITR